jgi:hypothetical protein
MLDRRDEVGAQFTRLIVDAFHIDAVALWDAREVRMDKAGKDFVPDDEVRATYFHKLSENDLAVYKFKRVLRLGSRPIGAIYIAGSSREGHLDPRSVDAIASLFRRSLWRERILLPRRVTLKLQSGASSFGPPLSMDWLTHSKHPWQRSRAQVRDCWKSTVLDIQRESSCRSSMNKRHVWLS